MEIYHANCPKQPEGQTEYPQFKWGGFSMAGVNDYSCPLCGTTLAVCDECTG